MQLAQDFKLLSELKLLQVKYLLSQAVFGLNEYYCLLGDDSLYYPGAGSVGQNG